MTMSGDGPATSGYTMVVTRVRVAAALVFLPAAVGRDASTNVSSTDLTGYGFGGCTTTVPGVVDVAVAGALDDGLVAPVFFPPQPPAISTAIATTVTTSDTPDGVDRPACARRVMPQ